MSDTELICKFLTREYQDEHPIIFIYVRGSDRSKKTAVERALENAKQVFFPAIPDYVIKASVKKFLEKKQKLYKEGLISIKPLYQ